MSRNRITPVQVLAAFKATGLVPVQGEYTDVTSDGRRCACGLSAVFIQQVEGDGYNALAEGDADDQITEKLGINQSYLNGFITGFDNGEKRERISLPGYEDGKAAWEAVKHLAVSEE